SNVIPVTEQTVQLAVGGHLSDGRILNLTSPASGTQYTVANTVIANVDANGLATAAGGGTTGVTALNGAVTANGEITVDHLPTISAVTTASPFVTMTAVGERHSLSAIGQFTNDTFATIATGFGTTFSSSNPDVARVEADG